MRVDQSANVLSGLCCLHMNQRTTKPTIRFLWPAKTQISLRICAVWSVFADRMCLLHPPGYPKRDKREPLPYWMDVQADFCCSLRSYCRYCSALVKCVYYLFFFFFFFFWLKRTKYSRAQLSVVQRLVNLKSSLKTNLFTVVAIFKYIAIILLQECNVKDSHIFSVKISMY